MPDSMLDDRKADSGCPLRCQRQQSDDGRDDPSGLDAVFLHLRVEQLAMDAQTTRRFGAVATGLAQRATDHRLLQMCSCRGQLALHEVLSLPRLARFAQKG